MFKGKTDPLPLFGLEAVKYCTLRLLKPFLLSDCLFFVYAV